ncbi:MAG: ATP-binding protein [Opitutaceae bacterium]|nr:ATP-binding protein [Opitutaceae bacterium]
MPRQISVLAKTMSGWAEAIVITKGRWEHGGARIIFANEAFARLTGYDGAKIVGQNTRLLHGPKTDVELLRHGTRADAAAGEGFLHRRDGSPFYASWNFSPVRNRDGRLISYVAFYRDLTEIRRLQEALLQAQKLNAVGQLAWGVAHDFNNLLSVINGYCEILGGRVSGDQAAYKNVEEIHKAGLKASVLTRQMLEFSRRREMEVQVINFNTLIREVVEILLRLMGEEITLDLRLASDQGNVRADPAQFQQVLLNLCFNARDAMPHGGRVTIRTCSHAVKTAADRRVTGMKPGNYAVLIVSDTGGGLDETTRRRMFEPFFTTKSNGTGLGLPTVQNVVKRSGGFIAVQSTSGQGTTFEIYLRETPEPEQTYTSVLPTLPVTRGEESVLLVEEDAVLRKMIAGILAADGYRVCDVGSVAEAQDMVSSTGHQPHLLLIDTASAAAASLIRKLYTDNSRLKVLSFSAAVPRHLDLPRPSLVHLPKPFALSMLMRNVRVLLDTFVS